MIALLLPDSLFRLFSDLVEEKSGIHYADTNLELFSERVWGRLLDAGFASPLDYYYYLRYDAGSLAEMGALIDELVVNETYFFRQPEQLLSLRDDVLRPLIEEGQHPRIWCAAASTGEEPLSVAMLLADAGLLSNVEIVASDISAKALMRAKNGEHAPSAVRALPEGVPHQWIDVTAGRVTVDAHIRSKIEWHQVNLLDDRAVSALGKFDAILCRNVLIYFRDETISRIVGTLSGALGAGGRLFVGASESLLRFGTLLRCEEKNGAFSYSRTDP